MVKNISEKQFTQAVFTKLNPNQQKCLNIIVKQFTLFDNVFISQKAIAAEIGLSRERVCKYIKYFCELGLIEKFRRFGKNFKKSNLYTFNNFFKEIKERLVQVLPCLKGWLGTPIYGSFKEKVTISIKGDNNSAPQDGTLSNFSSSSQDLSLNLLPQSIQMVGAEYSTKRRAYNYPKNDSKPKPTYLEWAPSSMEEGENFKKFIEEADTVPDYVESPTLDEIKNLITIPELQQWIEEY